MCKAEHEATSDYLGYNTSWYTIPHLHKSRFAVNCYICTCMIINNTIYYCYHNIIHVHFCMYQSDGYAISFTDTFFCVLLSRGRERGSYEGCSCWSDPGSWCHDRGEPQRHQLCQQPNGTGQPSSLPAEKEGVYRVHQGGNFAD